jgi:exonuclease VII large subunit
LAHEAEEKFENLEKWLLRANDPKEALLKESVDATTTPKKEEHKAQQAQLDPAKQEMVEQASEKLDEALDKTVEFTQHNPAIQKALESGQPLDTMLKGLEQSHPQLAEQFEHLLHGVSHHLEYSVHVLHSLPVHYGIPVGFKMLKDVENSGGLKNYLALRAREDTIALQGAATRVNEISDSLHRQLSKMFQADRSH